jgi:hypothetical protein
MKSKVQTFHSQVRRFEEPIQIIMPGILAFAQPIRTRWPAGSKQAIRVAKHPDYSDMVHHIDELLLITYMRLLMFDMFNATNFWSPIIH